MRIGPLMVSLAMSLGVSAAFAALVPWKDYIPSEVVWQITTIKVHSTMTDTYLEGLKKTWAAESEIRKHLGQIEDYHIYVSDLSDSGTFNLMLVAVFKNNEMLAPNEARYDAFMKVWGAERKNMVDVAHSEYPAIRDITGEYRMREITFTK